jgi:hypothetical protein
VKGWTGEGGGGEEVLRVKMEGTRNQESRTVKTIQIEKKEKREMLYAMAHESWVKRMGLFIR